MNEIKFNHCPLCGRAVDRFVCDYVARISFNALLPDTCLNISCLSCGLSLSVYTRDNPDYLDFDTCSEAVAERWNRLSARQPNVENSQ